jgi:hypothetical protein
MMVRRNLLCTPSPLSEHLLDQVEASLSCMGRTAGEVHWTILHSGIRGNRGATAFANPVIRYLARRLDVFGTLEIPFAARHVNVQLRGENYSCSLPIAVELFLDRFNQGMYPELESE